MKKAHIAMLALAMGLAFTSCSSVEDLGRFTIISSKNVDLSRLGEMKRSAETTRTKKLNAKFLFIRTKKISDTYIMENALDNALEKIPGAVAMVDAKLYDYQKKGFLGITKKWGLCF